MHQPTLTGRGPRAVSLRPQYNRVLVVVALAVSLPVVVAAERLRTGAGRRFARTAVGRVGRWCGLRVEVRGQHLLDPAATYVLVPNHSSLLDVPAVLVADEHVHFLAAAELFRVPLLAGAMRAIGTERIDRRHPATAYRQLAQMAARGLPHRLVIFAQGGIAPAGRPRPFKAGAFSLAIATGTPVVPVAIHGTDRALPPGVRLAIRPGVLTVELLAPIPTAALGPRDRRELCRRVEQAVMVRLSERATSAFPS